MNISVFGLGYVGCVSIGCLAESGHNVIGVDVNPVKIDLINRGVPTIVEDDIEKLISDNWKNGKIKATDNYIDAVNDTSISLLCVGTPNTSEGHLDLSAVFATAREIGEVLKEKDSFHVIVIRSTVLPGTNKKVSSIIEKYSGKKSSVDFGVISNPEFLREGTSVKDYYNPSMIVIGSDSEKASRCVVEMYKDIDAPFIVTDIKIAEMIKYVSNAFHANKIIFANEI